MAVAAVVIIFLGGCADPETATNADAAAAAAKGRRSAPIGTTREGFMPVLKRAHNSVTWPPSYEMTAEDIWNFMAPGARDTIYGEADAVDMVRIWNLCAWTMQLIDDTKVDRAIELDIQALTDLKNPANRELIDRITADAKLGELQTARQFVTANDCQKGFSD
jgi:hypothetical protein